MYETRECRRGCGLVSKAGPVVQHEKSCWTPRTLERLLEIGGVGQPAEGCWEWQPLKGGAYPWYPRIRQKKVMQLVCELTYGPGEHGQRPLHSCDNIICVRPSHLRWGTQSENIRDAYIRNRGIGRQRKKDPDD